MDSTPTFEPENKIPPRRCEIHDEEIVWIPVAGRQVMRCPSCLAGQQSADRTTRSDMPLIKFAQNFWRGRELTQKEKQHPPRKPQ